MYIYYYCATCPTGTKRVWKGFSLIPFGYHARSLIEEDEALRELNKGGIVQLASRKRSSRAGGDCRSLGPHVIGALEDVIAW